MASVRHGSLLFEQMNFESAIAHTMQGFEVFAAESTDQAAKRMIAEVKRTIGGEFTPEFLQPWIGSATELFPKVGRLNHDIHFRIYEEPRASCYRIQFLKPA